MAVEIETGLSKWRENIERDLGQDFSRVVVVCTNEQAWQGIRREAEQRWPGQGSRLSIVRAQEWCG